MSSRFRGFPLAVLFIIGLARPPIVATPRAWILPVSPVGGDIVNPYGRDVPPEVERFLERAGNHWFVAWDRQLAMPTFAAPSEPWPLRSEDIPADTQAALAAAQEFVTAEAEFLGVDLDDLGPLEAHRIADSFVIIGRQVHDDIPVRASGFSLRLTPQLGVLWLKCRVARELPEVARPVLSEADVEALALSEGHDAQLRRELQLAFPEGPDSATPVWAVISSLPDDELEILYSALDGTRLATFSTRFHWNGEDECRVFGHYEGFTPPAGDMFALPHEIPSAAVPLPYQHFRVGSGPLPDVEFDSRPDGSFDVLLPDGVTPDRAVVRDFPACASPDSRLDIEYTSAEASHAIDTALLETFNSNRTERGSLQLLLDNQLNRGRRDLDALRLAHGLPVFASASDPHAVKLEFSGEDYGHSFGFFVGKMRFGSVLGAGAEARDERDLWRKVVPTIVHHEHGHHVQAGLSNTMNDCRVAEGIADAIAGYVSRTGVIGFVDEATPNTDPAARDLRDDTLAWRSTEMGQFDGRRVVAGALWQLWDETLPLGFDDLPPLEDDASPLAFGVLYRLLGCSLSLDYRCQSLAYWPILGFEWLIEADQPIFGGNGALWDYGEFEDPVERAFGRRGLLPTAFVRGDLDGDTELRMNDSILLLAHLFLGGDDGANCPEARDVDDSGRVDLTDAIYGLNFLFLNGPEPPAPFTTGCGFDLPQALPGVAVEWDTLGCWDDTACRVFWPPRRPRG